MRKILGSRPSRTMSKEDRQQKAEDRERKKRKKCRESMKPGEKCNCSMESKCVTEGTHDWLNDQSVPDEPEETQD